MELDKQFAVHDFENLDTASFDLQDYSALKFGSDRVARSFGYQMGDKFYNKYSDILINNRCIIIPSAFNVVEIAATILARHFNNRLNDLLSLGGHRIVDWTTMHRSMSYVTDYCLMPKEERKLMLKGDKLYINRDFIKGKLLIFVDDITITGAHEDKVNSFLQEELGLTNQHIFCYYARYNGESAEIESQLNHSGISTIHDYIKLVNEPNHHLVVRAIRFLLDKPLEDLEFALDILDNDFIDKLYFACLAKGYDKIAGYRAGFELIRERKQRNNQLIFHL
jgi:hypothetical protein